MRKADPTRKKSGNETLKKPDDVKTEERIARDESKSSNQPNKIFS